MELVPITRAELTSNSPCFKFQAES